MNYLEGYINGICFGGGMLTAVLILRAVFHLSVCG